MDPKAIFDALTGLGSSTGVFSSVNGVEPTSAPVSGDAVHLALWSGAIRPAQSSGLNSASIRWEIQGRIYTNGFKETADDSAIGIAAVAFLAAISNSYTLGGLVRQVDIFGQEGDGLEATPGYLEQDKKVYRVMDLRIPLIINDVLDEVA